MALELRALDALLAADQADRRVALGQVDLEHHAAHHLALERAFADVGRQPAAVGHRQAHAPGVRAERAHFGAQQFEFRQAQRELRHPGREARRLALAQVRRRVAPVVHLVPAADLDGAELRVLKRFPVDVGEPVALLVAPLEQLQVVLDRVLAEPVDPLVALDVGRLVRRPDLDHPEQRAEVLVEPVLRAADDFLRVVLELVPDAHRGVAGELLAERGETFEGPQVLGDHVVVAGRAHRPQDHAAVGVEADRRADVRVRDDEVDHRTHLGFAGRVRAGADLLELLAPEGREVAVQVEPFGVAVDLDGLLYKLTGRKWGNLDVENETGCGIVPYTYKPSNLVNAVQWATGLELLLLIDDPWRVFLSTDHPNGACFWRYPEIVQLLMSADFRNDCMARLPSNIKTRITLPEIDREYTLYEIATIMSAGPARALGLSQKGNLGLDKDADIVIYDHDIDIARMFGHPRYVIKGGEIVIEEGDIRATPDGREFMIKPSYDPGTEEFLRPLFEEKYCMSFENYPVEMERIEQPDIQDCIAPE